MSDEIQVGDDSAVTVEVSGLSIYTQHGVSDEERAVGQRLLFDISMELDHCDAILTDRVDDTVDYASVCEEVAEIATQRSFRTLERLCEATACRLLERFKAVDCITIKATKPEPPLALAVGDVSVELYKERQGEEEDEDEE